MHTYMHTFVHDMTHSLETRLTRERHDSFNSLSPCMSIRNITQWIHSYHARPTTSQDTTQSWKIWLMSARHWLFLAMKNDSINTLLPCASNDITKHDSFSRDVTHSPETWLTNQKHDLFVRDTPDSILSYHARQTTLQTECPKRRSYYRSPVPNFPLHSLHNRCHHRQWARMTCFPQIVQCQMMKDTIPRRTRKSEFHFLQWERKNLLPAKVCPCVN